MTRWVCLQFAACCVCLIALCATGFSDKFGIGSVFHNTSRAHCSHGPHCALVVACACHVSVPVCVHKLCQSYTPHCVLQSSLL